MSKILVTPKINPDLDGTSCALAYANFLNKVGKDAEALIFGSPQADVRYFIEKHGVTIPCSAEDGDGEWSQFVLVDASSMKGMPKPIVAEKVVEVIDHRAGEAEKEFPNATIQNELIGAAATLVTEHYMLKGIKPHPDHAKLLYGGIYHNTLNFTSSNTHERDKVACRFLENECGVSSAIVREMFDYITREVVSDVSRALWEDAKEFGCEGYAVWAYQLIVWGDDILSQKEKIAESVKDLSGKMGVQWSYLNIVNLEDQTSTIFLPEKAGREAFSKALGREFTEEWTHLSSVLLRKQIMMKLRSLQ